MSTRHSFLPVGWLGAIGCWLAVASGCSPEYELLSSGPNQPAAGGNPEAGGKLEAGGGLSSRAGNAPLAVSGSGGDVAVAAGGESAVGGEAVGGAAAP